MRDAPPSGAAVYRGMDQATLDRQYSPSSRVASLDAYLREYERLSEAARRAHPVRTSLAYGPHPAERLDYFPGSGAGRAPLLVFVQAGTGRHSAAPNRPSRCRRCWPPARRSR